MTYLDLLGLTLAAQVRVDAFPIGIDPGRFEKAAESAAVRSLLLL